MSASRIDVLKVLLVSLLLPLFALAKESPRLKVEVAKLHPTQLWVGLKEVKWRKEEMRAILKKDGKDGLKDYLKEEAGSIVVGPGEKPWLVDGHHHARALSELKDEDSVFRDFELTVDVLKDWSELSAAQFQAAMRRGSKNPDKNKRPFVFLHDANGQEVPFQDLPAHVKDLKDYPLRSVVWLLEKADAIEKDEEFPFQEFYIAENLAPQIKVKKPEDQAAYLTATREALVFLENADEKDFPGLQPYKHSDIAGMLKRAQDHLNHH